MVKAKLSDSQITKIFNLVFGGLGIILNNSKSDPKILYNANLLVGKKKHWYGDFKLVNTYMLDEIANILGEEVYLLKEMDARFETESQPNLNKAIYRALPIL